MNSCGFVPVTFRHRLASIEKDIQKQTEERHERQKEFTKHLHELAARYNAVVASRIRRLSDEGIYINMDKIREQINRERMSSDKRRLPQTVLRKNVVNYAGQKLPRLKLELSFCSQDAQKVSRVDESTMKERQTRRQNKTSPVSKKTFRSVTSTVINIQRLTSRRHTVLSVVPIDLCRETNVPKVLSTEQTEKWTLERKHGNRTTGRQKSAYASLAGRNDAVKDAGSLDKVDGKVKLKRAVRKLGTMRHFQNIF